jgi:hypothetical protein
MTSMHRSGSIRDEHVHSHSDQFMARVAEKRLGLAIHQMDKTFRVDDNEGIWPVLEDSLVFDLDLLSFGARRSANLRGGAIGP